MEALSFAIGDVVSPKKNACWKPPPIKPEKYYVTDGGNGYEYGINGCAWFSFNEWELVHRATKQSLKIARQAMDEEE